MFILIPFYSMVLSCIMAFIGFTCPCSIYHLLIRAPFILISVLGNNSFMRSIPFPAIFPDNSNFPIFTSESSLGISISFVNSNFKLLISFSSNRTGGNSFTLIDIPLPMPSSWAYTLNLLNSPLFPISFFLIIQLI